MANLVLAFAELLAGAIIVDAGIKGDTLANVIQGKATQHPLTGSSTGTSSTGGNPTSAQVTTVAPGQYTNPVPGAITGRIDQGVDWTLGKAGFLAPGKAQIVAADQSNSGWGGGGYVAYKLLDGPLAGSVGYVAEGIQPAAGIAVGAIVNAGQQIALPVASPYNGIVGNIEAGWANPSSVTQPLAQTLSGYSGDQSEEALTAGYSFNAFATALGAVSGKFEGAGAALEAEVEKEFSGAVSGVPYG